MPLETTPWDTAEVLNTPEMREAFWQELLIDFEETGKHTIMRQGLDALQRALTMHGHDLAEEQIQKLREVTALAKGVAPAARSDQSGL